MPVKICDRCKRTDDSVMRSGLVVPGVPGRGRCKCNQLCEPCRDELIAEINQ